MRNLQKIQDFSFHTLYYDIRRASKKSFSRCTFNVIIALTQGQAAGCSCVALLARYVTATPMLQLAKTNPSEGNSLWLCEWCRPLFTIQSVYFQEIPVGLSKLKDRQIHSKHADGFLNHSVYAIQSGRFNPFSFKYVGGVDSIHSV